MLPSNVYSASSLILIGRTSTKRVKIGKYNVPIGMLFVLPTEAMNDWNSLDSDYEPRFGLLCAAEGCVIGLTLAHTPEAPHAYVITPDESVLIAAAHGWTAPLQVPPDNARIQEYGFNVLRKELDRLLTPGEQDKPPSAEVKAITDAYLQPAKPVQDRVYESEVIVTRNDAPTESPSVEASNTALVKARVRKPSPRKAPTEKGKAQDKSPKGKVAKAPARVA